jgi:hypothetical protein
MLVPGWHMQNLTTEDEIHANYKIFNNKYHLFFSIFLLMNTYFTLHCSVSNAIYDQSKVLHFL